MTASPKADDYFIEIVEQPKQGGHSIWAVYGPSRHYLGEVSYFAESLALLPAQAFAEFFGCEVRERPFAPPARRREKGGRPRLVYVNPGRSR